MSCGADWGQLGTFIAGIADFRGSSYIDRSLGLQYAGQRASFQAFCHSSATTRSAVSADVLADAVAGYK